MIQCLGCMKLRVIEEEIKCAKEEKDLDMGDMEILGAKK